MPTKDLLPEQVGFKIKSWCAAVGISRSKYYTLSPEIRPYTVVIGGQPLIRETPREYLRRIAELQAAKGQA